MGTFIFATKGCSHCKNLKHELSELDIDCEVFHAKDHPDLVEMHQIRYS